jgi:hypothetical protein
MQLCMPPTVLQHPIGHDVASQVAEASTQAPLPLSQTFAPQLPHVRPRPPHCVFVSLANGTHVVPSQQPSQSPHGLDPPSTM